MEFISKKDKIKDYLILSLIETIAELYGINYNIDKNIVKDNILNKLDQYNILDININQANVLELKNQIISTLIDDLPRDIIQNNVSLFNNYKNSQLIGTGGYANVYQVYNPLDDTKYAIKKIGLGNSFYQSIVEIRSMAKLNHKNIVRYHTSWIESIDLNKKIDKFNNNVVIFEDNTRLVKFSNDDLLNFMDNSCSTENSEYDESTYDKFLFIQMELCKDNLKDYLINNLLSFNDKVIICKQIIDGLKYIHDNNVIHRDLKLTNIFIDFDKNIKIGDFGLAINVYDMNYEEVGTHGYIAPEILEGKCYDKSADLYSLGIIILEIFGNFTTNMEKIMTIRKIKENKCDIFDNIELNNFISGLLKNNPDDRLSLNNVHLLLSNL
jgi:serine/threonine protein kinase